jgi:endonuclease-3
MVDISEVMEVMQGHYDTERRTTLNRMRKKPDPFKVLIGCLVSINIKDEVTDAILEELFTEVTSFEDIIKMRKSKLEKILYNARYRKVKAARLKEVSRDILKRFGGEVPRDREGLLTLKGVGPKTCNLVLNFAFGKKVIPVDSNTIRISNRLGWIESKKADDVERLLVEELEDEFIQEANAIFMLHGKHTCVSVSPHCSKCPVSLACKRVGVVKSR